MRAELVLSHLPGSAVMKIDIGITAKDRKAIASGLSHLLADTYTLYLKTHSFHWNVSGPMFNSLHSMFMVQYNELWLSMDEIAERIRALCCRLKFSRVERAPTCFKLSNNRFCITFENLL